MPDPVTNMGTTWYSIYTQAGRKCPWCDKAATLLEEKGLAFHMRPLGLEELREQAARAKMNTVPIIYHGVRLIGGYEELVQYLNEGADAPS